MSKDKYLTGEEVRMLVNGIEANFRAVQVRLREEEYEAQEARAEAYQRVKKMCPHENTKKEDDFDYHKREDWTIIRCTDCGAQVDRY